MSISTESAGFLPLYDKHGNYVAPDTRVAMNYDDELVIGKVRYEDGVPNIDFDSPTAKRGVTSCRVLHQNTPTYLDITVITPEKSTLAQEFDIFDKLLQEGFANTFKMVPVFLFEVDRVTDTRKVLGISLSEVQPDNATHEAGGPGHLTISSMDKSVFDGYAPGDQVLVTLQLATTQKPS